MESSDLNLDLEKQLKLKAAINQNAEVEYVSEELTKITLPFRQDGWRKVVSKVFNFPEKKTFELDYFGTEIFKWCDGETTFETMIDRYMEKWKFSFFEARALLMKYFQPLIKNNIIVFME